jgi:sugar-specific transcriptional regulator TrmB
MSIENGFDALKVLSGRYSKMRKDCLDEISMLINSSESSTFGSLYDNLDKALDRAAHLETKLSIVTDVLMQISNLAQKPEDKTDVKERSAE